MEGLTWLREHVLAGRIRVEFDDIEITPTIARIILEFRELKWPEESIEHPLPPDFMLNRPDIERLLNQREAPPTKRPGRPRRAGSMAAADRALVHRMNQMVSSFGIVGYPDPPPWPRVPSPTAAAKVLVDEGAVPGGGTNEAKVRRLVKRYKEIFGDDG